MAFKGRSGCWGGSSSASAAALLAVQRRTREQRRAAFLASITLSCFLLGAGLSELAANMDALTGITGTVELPTASPRQASESLPAAHRFPVPEVRAADFSAPSKAPFRGLHSYEPPAHAAPGGSTSGEEGVLPLPPWANLSGDAALRTKVPADFDWQAYLDYSSDLRAANVNNDTAARHYVLHGAGEGRIYKRLSVVLRYEICNGLFNQHYAHINALTIALLLGADIVLPSAKMRDSFAKFYSLIPTENEVHWFDVGAHTLWHTDFIVSTLANQGVVVAEAPINSSRGDLVVGASAATELRPSILAYERFNLSDVPSAQVVHVDLMKATAKLPEPSGLVAHLTRKITNQARLIARPINEFEREFPRLVLDVGCPFFAIKTEALPEATLAAKILRFAPHLTQIADMVVAGMLAAVTKAGGVTADKVPAQFFNGLHLRLEADQGWSEVLGGDCAYWDLFLNQIARAGFDRHTPLYIASGLFTYNDRSKTDHMKFKLAPYASRLFWKELFLPASVVSGLHSEQLALIDFLVLVRAKAFVGTSYSTFSLFVREYRHVSDVAARETAFMIKPPRQDKGEPYWDRTSLP